MKLGAIKIFVVGVILVCSKVAFSQLTTSELDQSADQMQGQYTPQDLGYIGMNSLGMIQSAWLDPLQNLGEGQSKPAYSKYYWSPDLVLPVRVRQAMVTLINFPKWELIEDLFIGDGASFSGEIVGPNALLLFPKQGAPVGVDTNVIVFGRSGNRYAFYVKSESVNTERLTNSIIDIEVIGDKNASAGGQGVYSSMGGNKSSAKPSSSLATKRFQKEGWLEEIPFNPEEVKFDIEVYVPNPDDVVIAPERVWRDNIFTYIDLGKKSLNMLQRPIVTMIVEKVEVPVGFRTKGPNNRLIIVEGVGDMVLRNGKRLVCLKMRRSPAQGIENYSTAERAQSDWDVSPVVPAVGENRGSMPSVQGEYNLSVGGSDVIVPQYSGTPANMPQVSYQQGSGASAQNVAGMYYAANDKNKPLVDKNSTISVELGTDDDVNKLENLWNELSVKHAEVLTGYEPFFSVDAPADGQGKELFHLRVGPIQNLADGDRICSRLGRNGVFCSVVRTQ